MKCTANLDKKNMKTKEQSYTNRPSTAFRLGIHKLASLMLTKKDSPADWPTFAMRALDSLGATERHAVVAATDAAFTDALSKEVLKQEMQNQLGNHDEKTFTRREPAPKACLR